MEKVTILFHLRKANLVRNIKVFMLKNYTIKYNIRVDKYFLLNILNTRHLTYKLCSYRNPNIKFSV